MTADKDLKRLVRARMAKTGESYTAALRHIRARVSESKAMSTTQDYVRSCSFCGKTNREARKLIAGPTVLICDECVSAVHKLQDGRLTGSSFVVVTTPGERYCDFCGRNDKGEVSPGHKVVPARPDTSEEVSSPQLYEGKGGCICEQCVGLCDEILTGRHNSPAAPSQEH